MVATTQSNTPWSRLRWARNLAEISARKLDRLAGLGLGHTALLESERSRTVDVRTAQNLASVLGLSLDWLINGEGEHPSADHVKAAVARAEEASELPTGTG